jgi:hypothetical protein
MINVIRWIIDDGSMACPARVDGATTGNLLALEDITFVRPPDAASENTRPPPGEGAASTAIIWPL